MECRRCNEYTSVASGLCPLCKWRATSEEIWRGIAYSSLVGGLSRKPRHFLGKPRPLMEPRARVELMREAATRFYALPVPQHAVPRGFANAEFIGDVAEDIKRTQWRDVASHLWGLFVEIGNSHPRLLDEGALDPLLSVAHDVMLSVVADHSGLPAYLTGHGFVQVSQPRPSVETLPMMEIEITGGYYSYMRGDKKASGSRPTIFPFIIDLSGLQRRSVTSPERFGGTVTFATSRAESRDVAHIFGPGNAIRAFLETLNADRSAPVRIGSIAGDLAMTLSWWTERSSVEILALRLPHDPLKELLRQERLR